MGKNNRQRRREKQRRRDRQRSQRMPGGDGHREPIGSGPFGPGGVRYRADQLPSAVLIRAAAVALADGDPAQGTRLVSEVTMRPDARRCTAEAVDDLLTALADHCWEPRLVVNLVRRRLTVRHAKVVQHGLDSPDDVGPAIEALGVLLHLPALPPLPSTPKMDETDAKVLAKVRGLLAKAESTTYPDEAEALSAKAQELMARHAIDAALASAGARPEVPGGRRLPLEDPYADAKSLLLGAVARANRCQSVHSVQLAHATVLGFESDLVAVELLFTSLFVQANRAMLAVGRDARSLRQRGFRSSFLSAYATRIGERLEASTAAEVADANHAEGGRLLPVLAARTDAVDDAVAAMFGDSLVARKARISDPRGWVAGQAAADLADLAVGPQVQAAG